MASVPLTSNSSCSYMLLELQLSLSVHTVVSHWAGSYLISHMATPTNVAPCLQPPPSPAIVSTVPCLTRLPTAAPDSALYVRAQTANLMLHFGQEVLYGVVPPHLVPTVPEACLHPRRVVEVSTCMRGLPRIVQVLLEGHDLKGHCWTEFGYLTACQQLAAKLHGTRKW